MARFERPYQNLMNQDKFAPREPGLTHPDTDAYIRLRNNGDLELVISDGLGMVFNKRKRSVTIIADEIKFLTNPGDSIRWNDKRLNSQAFLFTQPALVPTEEQELYSPYNGTEEFFETDA